MHQVGPHRKLIAAVSPRVLAVVLLIVVLAGMIGLAWYTLDQARSIKPQTKASSPKATPSDLTSAERRYLDALAHRIDLPPTESWDTRRLLALAVRLNSEINARTPLALDPARTPWLLPFPITRPTSDLPNAQTLPLDLASGKIDLPPEAAFYQYSITNTGDTPRPMPILFQGLRWDHAEALITSAGLRQIDDELDRAIAIWRLVASHRYHAEPPTEGPEEHDLIKFLSCHGYGFCDDSAQAVAALAQLCKLQVRLIGLTGHVVPEIFAAGKWRMFDPDFAVYFHAPSAPREILSLAQLSQNRAAFTHPVALGPGGPYDGAYADPFLSTNDNGEWPITATTTHRIQHNLAPGERIVFTNYNWGRPFLGTSPQRVPRYYNGYFTIPIPESESAAKDASVSAYSISNSSNSPARVSFDIEIPFPVVGGTLWLPTGEDVAVGFEDLNPSITARPEILLPEKNSGTFTTWSLDTAISKIAESPTYRFRLHLTLPPHYDAGIQDGHFSLRVDFQFAELPLLKLKPGPNTFQVYGNVNGFEADLNWAPRTPK